MPTTPASERMLRAHLAAGAAKREAFIAKVFVALTSFAIAVVIVFSTPEHRGSAVRDLPLYLPIAYHAGFLLIIRRGWFHPSLPWINAAVQASLLALPYYVVACREGVPFISGNAMYGGWIVIVGASALKVAPRISIASGVLAGIEYLAISLYVADGGLSDAQRSELFIKAGFFVLAGLLAAAIATYLIRQAQDALRAVREQDLMGKYFIHEPLGAGGMAEVFRATYSPEGGFEKIVAVKRVLPEIAAAADGRVFLEMFREEAKLCAQLSHPNVVQVLDAGKFRDSYVLTMEYVDGLALHHVLRRGPKPMPLCAATFVAAELAAALDYIHTRRDRDGNLHHLVHRDVNPPNVLISRFGEVKLADFGVAHAVNRSTLDRDRVYGKIGYLAPEQLGGSSIDGRADLFALGLTLYEMIVGRPLFRGASMWEVREFRAPEADLAATPHGALPDELRGLIVELLAPLPEDRPATGGEVRTRLLALASPAAPLPAGPGELARCLTAAQEARERPAPSLATAETKRIATP